MVSPELIVENMVDQDFIYERDSALVATGMECDCNQRFSLRTNCRILMDIKFSSKLAFSCLIVPESDSAILLRRSHQQGSLDSDIDARYCSAVPSF